MILLLLSTLQVVGWHHEFSTLHFNPGPVVKIMESSGIKEFYASYWIGYPVMFLGEGRLIGSPMLLPYREPFSDRRPQYTEQVRRSGNAAFVFGSDEKSLEMEFLSFLKIHDITYETVEIDGTSIYYRLSKPAAASYDKKDRHNFFSLKDLS